MHVHIPVRIVIDEASLELGELGQCHCGLVAHLQRWAHRPWLRRTDPESSHGLFWQLHDDWREPDEAEAALLADECNNMLREPEGFSVD